MAKYYKFNYYAGYDGADENAVFEFPDDASEKEVADVFDHWYGERRKDYGYFDEITEAEAEDTGVDRSYMRD